MDNKTKMLVVISLLILISAGGILANPILGWLWKCLFSLMSFFTGLFLPFFLMIIIIILLLK